MFTLFLAKRFFRPNLTDDESKRHRGASVPAIRIATAGIAVGLAVMIITVCVVKGFQREVSNKIVGFASHIEVMDERSYASPEAYPLVTDKQIIEEVRRVPGVVHVQRISEKMGIFKTENDFAGMCLKGVSSADYDLSFIRDCIVEGKLPEFSDNTSSNSIAISQLQAEKLHLHVGDKVNCYFFERTIKQRVFRVAAIYNTNMHQYDKTFVLTDLHTVNRLNSWQPDQSSGLEVRLTDMNQMDATHIALNRLLKNRKDREGHSYTVIDIRENPRSASVISWLKLLDFNVLVILVIMICVAGFTMVSGLLILILERTSTIGVLKALGASNNRVRHTFLWYAAMIISRGMLMGNVIGLGIAALQDHFKFIHLDPSSYYVDAAPVEINWLWIAGINAVTLLITMLALILPSYLASSVQPAKAIQFD